ncbi:hypothetical protein D9M72_205010 [compost metagenome]
MQATQETEYHYDEEGTGNIESPNEEPQRTNRLDSIASDRESHRPESPDGCHPHDDAKDGEKHVGEAIDGVQYGTSRGPNAREPETAQHREQQDGKDLTLRERPDERIRDDVQCKVGKAVDLDVVGKARRNTRIELLRVDVHTCAGLHQKYRDETG